MRIRFALAMLAATAMAPGVALAGGYAAHDAATDAAVGGAVAGPAGAAAGAIVGGTLGAAADAATAIVTPPPPPVVTYVEREDIPSVAVEQDVVVGRPLPHTVILHPVPRYHYEYAVVNHQRVIVDPQTRTVVKIID